MRLPREILEAVETAKSKKRKSFRMQDTDEFTIATIKYIAKMRDQTIAEVIAEAVCVEINDHMTVDIVEDWLGTTLRARATAKRAQSARTRRINKPRGSTRYQPNLDSASSK
jgi:hypothetical protein